VPAASIISAIREDRETGFHNNLGESIHEPTSCGSFVCLVNGRVAVGCRHPCAVCPAAVRAPSRPSREGCHLGAHAAGAREQDARHGKDDVIDLGSGDGITVITAAKRGATALGIEYNPDMVELSKRNAASAGVSERASFMKADIFESDYSRATVITMFLLPSLNLRLRPTILDLKPGTRIVSNSFDMEDWQADETATITDDCVNFCTALLWIVPAKVEGVWRLPQGDLRLEQQFQMISGTLGSSPISQGRLRGSDITFLAAGAQYTGRVDGSVMRGTVTGGSGGTWTATRR
jgi:hypothetical protein